MVCFDPRYEGKAEMLEFRFVLPGLQLVTSLPDRGTKVSPLTRLCRRELSFLLCSSFVAVKAGHPLQKLITPR